jgi:DNA-binding transcriptional MocR family regulator
MGPINFFKGHPTYTLLPTEEIALAYQKILLETDYLAFETDPLNQNPLTYGTDPGNYDVRKTISEWNNRNFGTSSSYADNINLTGGASYGIANILTAATDPSITKRAFVVTPTYFLINSSFIDAGLVDKMTAINEVHDGEYDIDLHYLENQMKHYSGEKEKSIGEEVGTKIRENAEDDKEINIISDPIRPDRKIYQFVMYIVPTFSNPGGISYSIKTRTKLIELARKYDMLIISDDVYELLDYTDNEKPLPRLNYLDLETLPPSKTFGNTISNATFSKIIAPGLRVGWQETATPKLVAQLACTGANRSGGTPAQLATFVVGDLIKAGTLDKILEKFVATYKKRVATLLESCEKYLPNAKVYGGQGGYFLWVEFDEKVENQKVLKILAEEHNVIIPGGEYFEVVGDEKNWGKNCVRLSISFLSDDEIEEGIKIWGKVIEEVSGGRE